MSDGPDAVFLDMDGTLIDTEGIWWDAEVELFAELGHRLDDAWRHVVVGGPMERAVGFLLEATGAHITLPELMARISRRFEERISGHLPLMPGAARLLAELAAHQVPMALVSASSRRTIGQVLTSLGAQHFTLTVSRDDVIRTKPHPESYLRAAAGLGVDPARCVAIEDSASGVAAAEAAGCPVVAVPSVAPIPPAAGRTVVRSLEEVDLLFLQGLSARRATLT